MVVIHVTPRVSKPVITVQFMVGPVRRRLLTLQRRGWNPGGKLKPARPCGLKSATDLKLAIHLSILGREAPSGARKSCELSRPGQAFWCADFKGEFNLG